MGKSTQSYLYTVSKIEKVNKLVNKQIYSENKVDSVFLFCLTVWRLAKTPTAVWEPHCLYSRQVSQNLYIERGLVCGVERGGEEQDLWLVGGIVQHIDSSVNERKMTDDSGRGQRKTAVRTYLGKTVGHGNYSK